jgi:hypothetical protein
MLPKPKSPDFGYKSHLQAEGTGLEPATGFPAPHFQ